MIKMIKGTYGLERNGVVEAKTKNSEPFALSKERESELIALGVAEKVEDEYTKMKMSDLRDEAKKQGIDVKGIKSKEEIIEKLRED
jgi:hypothetical protein